MRLFDLLDDTVFYALMVGIVVFLVAKLIRRR